MYTELESSIISNRGPHNYEIGMMIYSETAHLRSSFQLLRVHEKLIEDIFRLFRGLLEDVEQVELFRAPHANDVW